jgi:hypothetical protein
MAVTTPLDTDFGDFIIPTADATTERKSFPCLDIKTSIAVAFRIPANAWNTAVEETCSWPPFLLAPEERAAKTLWFPGAWKAEANWGLPVVCRLTDAFATADAIFFGLQIFRTALELLLSNLGILFRLFDKRPSLGTSNRSQTAVQLTSYRRKKKNAFAFGASTTNFPMFLHSSLCFCRYCLMHYSSKEEEEEEEEKTSFRSGASLHQFGHQNMQIVHKLTEKVLRQNDATK